MSICLEILFTVGAADGILVCCFPCRCMNTKQAHNHCTDIVKIQTKFAFLTIIYARKVIFKSSHVFAKRLFLSQNVELLFIEHWDVGYFFKLRLYIRVRTVIQIHILTLESRKSVLRLRVGSVRMENDLLTPFLSNDAQIANIGFRAQNLGRVR